MNAFIVTLFLQAHDIQILSTDDIISVDIHPGELMEEIGPLVIDPFMGLVQLNHEFSAVIGAFLSSGKLSLDILELCTSLLCEPRILHRIPIAIHDKGCQTNIQTYNVTCFR